VHLQGNAKLADVGLARELQGGPTHAATQRIIGTTGFIDPLYSEVCTHTYMLCMRPCTVHHSVFVPSHFSRGGGNQDLPFQFSQSGQFSELTDGYAMGVSLLMCLGGRPAIAVVNHFGAALQDKEQRRAPAANFTDRTAEWPPHVAKEALKVVRGLMWSRIASRRMVLSQALSKLEHIANSEGVLPGIADDQEEARSCVICMSAPRSVRFLQMLRIEGRMWELSASTIACAAVKTHIQLQEHA